MKIQQSQATKRAAVVLGGSAVVLSCLVVSHLLGPLDPNDPSLPSPRLPPRVYPAIPSPVQLTDITQAAGLHFKHNSGASGFKLYPETMGGGAAFLDFDGDGRQDIFFVNGRNWTPAEISAYKKGSGVIHREKYGFVGPTSVAASKHTTGALYRNNGNGTFSDVTQNSGLAIEMLGQGATVGDYDNDGRPDLYVTSYGHNFLFHNETSKDGVPHFREVAASAGVQDAGFGTGAAWVDYDRDGKLDLFVCRYIEWNPAIDVWAFGSRTKKDGGYQKTYAGPPSYDGEASHLYHNIGGGRFQNVSEKAGIYGQVRALNLKGPLPGGSAKVKLVVSDTLGPRTMGDIDAFRSAPPKRQGKSLGVALCDFNNDGWPDILVTNDTVRNYLFQNLKNGTFSEVGIKTGVSYGPAGRQRAGMGVDTGDVDHSNRDSIVMGNYAYECVGLYHNEGGQAFSEIAGQAQLVRTSRPFLTFGCTFLDINNDGWLDILTANGHVQDTVASMERSQTYAQRPLLYISKRDSPVTFEEVGEQAGPAMNKPIVGRGLAYADVDLDGDDDVIFTTIGAAPELLRNDPQKPNNALRLTLEGTKSNRSAIGALVEASVPLPGQSAPMSLRRMVKSGSSYLSQSELPLTLGLAGGTKVTTLSIQWPSGKRTLLRDIAANQALTVNEDLGIVKKAALARH